MKNSAGPLEVVQFLARHLAEIDLPADEATALYLATKGGYTGVVVYLLHRQATADVVIGDLLFTWQCKVDTSRLWPNCCGIGLPRNKTMVQAEG
ncbi:hypothetical protein P3T76_001793 [Phytophthora citrophthora]|uniref:Uncharacterized protein n=1 Tax=Phytophthora citrophthora TaxID=4793 RepID=A0AAD9GWE7_9STRA|nr:hypothetical protein P3T76_001793 [Phytophthora citrophthora]